MAVRINAARASLLTLTQGQEQYQRELAATKAELAAGIITQAQADAQDNKTITAYIARLQLARAEVKSTSAAFQDLTTKIIQQQTALAHTTAWGTIKQRLTELANQWGNFGKNVSDLMVNQMTGAINGVAQSVGELAMGVNNTRQAFYSFIQQSITGLVQLMGQQLASYALSKTLKQHDTEDTLQQNTQKLASNATTGLLESITTWGVAAAVGAAAFLAAMAIAGSFAEGGLIPGSPSHSDNRIAHVATGEYIVRTSAVQHYGIGVLEAINSMSFPLRAPAYAEGGLVGASAALLAAGGAGGGAVNKITVTPQDIKVNLIQPHTRSAMLEVLRSAEGHTYIVDAVARNKHRLPFKQ